MILCFTNYKLCYVQPTDFLLRSQHSNWVQKDTTLKSKHIIVEYHEYID